MLYIKTVWLLKVNSNFLLRKDIDTKVRKRTLHYQDAVNKKCV